MKFSVTDHLLRIPLSQFHWCFQQ